MAEFLSLWVFEGHKVEVSEKIEQMQIIWGIYCCNKNRSQNYWLKKITFRQKTDMRGVEREESQ